ncbi:serine kinase [Acetobacter estunensis]|uniref:Serine kinase n=1 Tax=Acetobacter estunensis TaxID=104097 RepID=A0A967BC35_9PROT|nr:serine kinase [Acetobacter estunensis]NHO53642.1 serine kinase [Acetobacter estunensis]
MKDVSVQQRLPSTENVTSQHFHAGCSARNGAGVLIFGPPGAGKSDLLLRLLGRGHDLVADDRVELTDGVACASEPLRGLIEVRGWGIVQRAYLPAVRAVLAVHLVPADTPISRMPEENARCPLTDLPLLRLHGLHVSAPERVDIALDCLTGRALLLPQGCMPGDDG